MLIKRSPTANAQAKVASPPRPIHQAPPPVTNALRPTRFSDGFEAPRAHTRMPDLTGGALRGGGPVSPPTHPRNGGEVGNLWSDINVQGAQAQVPTPGSPGADQTIVTIDFTFGNSADHGYYTTEIATGHAGAPLPGVAAGASGQGVSWGSDPDMGNGAQVSAGAIADWFGIPGGEDFAKDGARDMLADGAPATFQTAADLAGPNGVVQVTSPMDFVNKTEEAIDFLEAVQSFTDSGGIVVLPSNLFSEEIASDAEVQQAFQDSGAIIVTPLMRDGNGDGTAGDYSYPNGTNGQPSTLPTDMITIAVPTTNGNNSVAVPGVAGTIALMQQVNPDLEAADVQRILSDPTSFTTLTLPDGHTVTVLDASAAVATAAAER